jgi:hypothetical protein
MPTIRGGAGSAGAAELTGVVALYGSALCSLAHWCRFSNFFIRGELMMLTQS